MSKQEYIDTPQDIEFVNGFNNGWIIAEYQPKTSKIIVGALQRVENHGDAYLEGVQKGILYREVEKTKERYRNYQPPNLDSKQEKDKDIDPNR